MARPTGYNKTTNFNSYALQNPTNKYNAPDHDAEFANIETAIDSTQVTLNGITRDDGLIANGAVHPQALSPQALMTVGGTWNPRGLWDNILYQVGDVVERAGGVSYVCAFEHVGNDFPVEKGLGYWVSMGNGLSAATEEMEFWASQGLTYRDQTAVYASTTATNAANALASETNAAASASAAATTASNVSTSVTAAATSATNAANSATAAAGSATAASNSATSASGSASTAATQATNASNSAATAAGHVTTTGNNATAAATSATNAGNSATAAATSATNAGNSATAASTSATNASNSAASASGSVTAAGNSATAAAGSASSASSSATAASGSATAAANSAIEAANAKIIWRGSWSGATSYIARDAVESAGSSYICKLANTNQLPPNATYWDLLSAKGDIGPAGAGSGDVLSVGATSVDNEIALYSGTGGKTIKRATVSGLLKGTSGVLSAAVAGDVTGQLITGFVSGSGTVAATDTILQAINKIDGNVAGKAATGHNHDATYAPIGAKYIVQTADAALTGEQALGALATGILYNTTTTGVLSIATAAQVTGNLLTGFVSGSGTVAATDTILQAVNKLDGNVGLRQLTSGKDAASGYAGLTATYQINFKNNANTFTSLLTNANTAARTYTFPDATGTVYVVGQALGTPASGTLTNCTFPTLNQSTTGSAASATSLTGTTQSTAIAWSGAQTFTVARETRVAMGANDVNQASGNYFTKTISAITTFTVSSTPATGTASSFILELTNGGAFAITWWAGVKWASGTAPTLTAAGVDILGFYTHDGGTTWRGLLLAKDSK
jgi:hypothetical protein